MHQICNLKISTSEEAVYYTQFELVLQKKFPEPNYNYLIVAREKGVVVSEVFFLNIVNVVQYWVKEFLSQQSLAVDVARNSL